VKIYNSIEEFGKIDVPVLTTGTFDGVHLGHQKILRRIKETALKHNGQTVLLTFFPHPRMVLFPEDNDLKLLNTQKEKVELLEQAGIEHLIVHPFTVEFSRLSSVEFVRDILVNQIGTKKLVIGYNHHFGRNREGTLEHLMEFGPVYGFDVEEIPAKDVENVNISSTKIRNALLQGDIFTANKYLGYCYSLTGTVVEGSKVGRSIGFPTANIEVKETHKLIPADGVYAARAEVGGTSFNGMLNIGKRPTITDSEEPASRSIEINLFDFTEDIYGEEIKISLVERLREEKKFDDLEELKRQLARDREDALKMLV